MKGHTEGKTNKTFSSAVMSKEKALIKKQKDGET